MALLTANPPFSGVGTTALKVRGIAKSVETIPGANGDKTTLPPTDGYTCKLLDAYGYDILGTLAARSGLLPEKTEFSSKPLIDSELTLTIAAAGNGKKGRVIVEFDAVDTASVN